MQIPIFYIDSIYKNLSLCHIIKSAEKIHNRRFSSSGRPQDSHRLTFFHRKADIVDDVLTFHFIRDIAELDISLHFLALNALFRLLNVRFFGIRVVDFFHRCDKTLYVINPPARETKRIGEHPQIAIDCDKISQCHLAADHLVSAIQNKYDHQKIGKQLKNRYKTTPDRSGAKLRLAIFIVFFFKFFFLVFFFCKCLYHAISADIFLHKGIEAGKTLAAFVKFRLYIF